MPNPAEPVAAKIEDAAPDAASQPTATPFGMSVVSEAEIPPVDKSHFIAPEPSSPNTKSSYNSSSPAEPYFFSGGTHTEPLPPPDTNAEVMPVAVVQVVSTRGVEYAMLTLALWLGALSLLGVLLSLINGGRSAEVLAFPASVLVVCLPVFSFFFLRLKKAELQSPDLKLDPSKRRLTQFTQLIAFAVCLFTLIAFVYFLISTISGTAGTSIMKAIFDVIAVLFVAGGILAYYWFDEHKTKSGR